MPVPNSRDPNEPTPLTLRTEAFSDAVIAIILTLMAVELLKLDRETGQSLAEALVATWPSYFAFLMSFVVVGQMWITHHNMWRHIERVDQPILILNLALLASISAIPFGANLIAAGLTGSDADFKLATLVYAAIALVQAILFNLVLWHAQSAHLCDNLMHESDHRSVRRRFLIGPSIYASALLLSFVSPYLSLVCYLAVALLYIWPQIGELEPADTPSNGPRKSRRSRGAGVSANSDSQSKPARRRSRGEPA